MSTPRQKDALHFVTVAFGAFALFISIAQGGQVAVAQGPVVEVSAPPGSIIAYGGSNAPPSWLLANGDPVSRVQYADLFAAIGTTYGSGNGTTTFNLPDLTGRVVVGEDDVANRLSTNENLGESGGEEKHTLTVAELPAHTHGSGTLATNSAGSHHHGGWTGSMNRSNPHTHGGTNGHPGFIGGGCCAPSANLTLGGGGYALKEITPTDINHEHSISWDGAHSHDVTTGSTSSTGSSDPQNNMPPYQVANYIIKT